MERAMAVSLRESVGKISDPGNLDASVMEVFQLMLGVECKRTPDMRGSRTRIGDGRGGIRGSLERSVRLPLRECGGHGDCSAHDGHGVSRS